MYVHTLSCCLHVQSVIYLPCLYARNIIRTHIAIMLLYRNYVNYAESGFNGQTAHNYANELTTLASIIVKNILLL